VPGAIFFFFPFEVCVCAFTSKQPGRTSEHDQDARYVTTCIKEDHTTSEPTAKFALAPKGYHHQFNDDLTRLGHSII
jgi:hypothetical protein